MTPDTGPSVISLINNIFHGSAAIMRRSASISSGRKFLPLLRGIRRSPHGRFEKAEVLDPEQIAFLIKRPQKREGRRHPKWLNFLQQLFRGIFTFDNIDYVLRDAYMTGVSIGPVDWRRLFYYTSFSQRGIHFG